MERTWFSDWRPTRRPMLDRVFVADFRDAVSLIQLEEPLSVIDMSFKVRIFQTRGNHLRRIRELISGPLACPAYGMTLLDQFPQLALLGQEDHISSLQRLLCGDELKEELDSEAPGLRCRAFHIAICVAHVSVDGNGTLGSYSLPLVCSNVFVELTRSHSHI